MNHTFTPPGWPRAITVNYTYRPANRGSGESGYSLGSPPSHECCEVDGVTLNGDDITDWLESIGMEWDELARLAMDHHYAITDKAP